jgi:hypothetical protein
MNIEEIINSKALKPKEKTLAISNLLLDKNISTKEIIDFAKKATHSKKATCIEALEFSTRQNPTIVNEKCLQFITQALLDNAPRVKWESAKVIGNIAHLFPTKLKKVIENLILNSNHSGTVVRWASASALNEILKLNTKFNKEIIVVIEKNNLSEKNNAVKKIYTEMSKYIK